MLRGFFPGRVAMNTSQVASSKEPYHRMKTTGQILTIILSIVFFSCGQSTDTKSNSVVVDTLQTNVTKQENERLEKWNYFVEHGGLDSLRVDEALKGALKIATQNSSKDRFYKKYDVMQDSIPVSVEISLDHHFTKAKSHLIIRRKDPDFIYIDIYSRKGDKFENVLFYNRWKLEYMNDTIQDINGDGLDDFVVNWYGNTGCCLKAFSNVYLLRTDQKTFSNNFEFINPTFSPKEKIIRGICYGHPGKTDMYKYKWNSETIDTLEYISYEKNEQGEKTGKVIVSTSQPNGSNFKVLKRLNSVPNDYRKIEGYDWFTGEGYE